jgi:hypothetical protein
MSHRDEQRRFRALIRALVAVEEDLAEMIDGVAWDPAVRAAGVGGGRDRRFVQRVTRARDAVASWSGPPLYAVHGRVTVRPSELPAGTPRVVDLEALLRLLADADGLLNEPSRERASEIASTLARVLWNRPVP